jgi:hypothetical protein
VIAFISTAPEETMGEDLTILGAGRVVPGAAEQIAAVCLGHDYGGAGKPQIAWDDPPAPGRAGLGAGERRKRAGGGAGGR